MYYDDPNSVEVAFIKQELRRLLETLDNCAGFRICSLEEDIVPVFKEDWEEVTTKDEFVEDMIFLDELYSSDE